MQPTTGRIVMFKLVQRDVEAINRRRTTGVSIAERMKLGTWPQGAQAHIGNPVTEGDILPMIVCRVWPDEFGPGTFGVNGQVFLDGCDNLWITSAGEGIGVGQWSWPEKV